MKESCGLRALEVHEQLIYIDINTLTPIEALMKWNEFKKRNPEQCLGFFLVF
jgi:hypothetical protein